MCLRWWVVMCESPTVAVTSSRSFTFLISSLVGHVAYSKETVDHPAGSAGIMPFPGDLAYAPPASTHQTRHNPAVSISGRLRLLVHGTRADVEALREEVAIVLAPLGLRLSAATTQIVHMSEGFDFLGFHIQWRRKYGTNQLHVYTFIAHRPIRSLKAKIRAQTSRTSQQNPRDVLIRLNQIMRGWAKQAVCKHTLHSLAHFVCWRVGPVAADAAPLEVEGRPAQVDHTRSAVADDRGGRDRVVPPRSGAGYPVSLAR